MDTILSKEPSFVLITIEGRKGEEKKVVNLHPC